MSTDQLTILAIDDEPRALGDLARLLRASPGVLGVECAGDGEEALRRAASTPFDAVFLDVRMPGLDGLELARVLRRFAAAPQLVFVSAHDSAAVDAFELHALDYLRKPVARARVREAVDRVLDAVQSGEAWPARPEIPEPRAPGGDGHDVIAATTSRGATRLLDRDEIEYVTSSGDFVEIVTADGSLPAARDAGRAGAPLGAPRVRARAPPVRGQPAPGGRAAPAAGRHGRAGVRRRGDGSGGAPARGRVGTAAERLLRAVHTVALRGHYRFARRGAHRTRHDRDDRLLRTAARARAP